MKYYHMNIAGLDRDLPICPLNEKISIAGFVLLGDYELTEACAKALLEKLPEFDYMIAPEAKSIGLINEMARLSGSKKHFVARKAMKAYMTDPLTVSVKSITTKSTQTLYLDRADADMIKGKKIVIIDDVISTGESLDAVRKLMNEAGAIEAAACAYFAEGDAADRKDIIFLEKLPLFFK